MPDVDIISTYFPEVSEIPSETLRATRERLVNYMRRSQPALDMRPNTPFGDHYITPAAEELAALEIAVGRILNDLDLDQIAKGVIYNCFGRETEFVTRSGVKSFRDYADGDVVTVLTAKGNWKPATIRNHGSQRLNRIRIRRGKLDYVIRATEDHRWLLRDGSETTALRVGDVLQEAPCIFSPWDYFAAPPEERVAWAYGYIFGDGTILRDADGVPQWSCVRLCREEKQKFAERFRELGFSEASPKSCRGDVMFSTGRYIKEPLSTAESFSVLQAFCRGYLDADGSKNYNRPNSLKSSNQKEYLSIQATGEPHRSFIRDIFPVIGQYVTYEHDKSDEITNLGRRGETSDFGLNNWIYDHAPKFIVAEITEDGAEDVWCLEVEDDHSFVFPFGLSTGNCPFVEAFLKNFAAVPLESLPATGIMRLTFSIDQDYELNRSLQFSFIGDDVARFSFRVPHDGPVLIRQVKAPLDSRENQFQLVELAANTYAVDIPVSGYMNEPVTAGTTGRSSEVVDCLSGIIAVVDFDDGVPEDSLSKIAERSRQAFHAQTLSSRIGAISFVLRQFPETQAVSPVIAGDYEMVRDTMNPLGIATGGMDLYTRSKHAGHVITQRVRLDYFQTQEADPQDVYVAKVDFLHTPHVIKSITWADNPAIDLGDRGTDIVVFSRSADANVAPGLLCAFSPLEELYVTVKMPRTSAGAPYINNLIDGAGQPYAWFNITYITDPTLTTIYDHVTADANHPIGSRIHARGFNLIYFDELTIDYRRRPGTSTNLTAARTEIVDFINSCGGPEFPYSDGPIIDAMYYNANKAQVMAIRSVAKVRWTSADRFLLPGDHLPTVNYTDALADSSALQNIFIHESGSFLPAWKDPNLGQPTSLHAVVGPRNVAYLIEAENLKFNEI